MTTFPLHRVLSDNPPTAAFEGVVMNAPRPLFGLPVACDLMGDTRVIDEATRALIPNVVQRNRDLDACVVVWTSRAEALHDAHSYVAQEYDQDTADEADEDTLLDVWAQHFRSGTVEV